MDKGYIKLFRSIRDNVFWSDKPFDRARAWIDLLLRASFTEGKVLINGKVRKIEEGQLFISIGRLSADWGWSEKKVRLFLDELISEEMITKKGQAKGTLLTIVNYGFYQGKGQAKGRAKGRPKDRAEDEQKTSRRQTYKNVKNVKNVKEDNIEPPADEDDLKRPMTEEELKEGGWTFY